jgi:hypothetical protein
LDAILNNEIKLKPKFNSLDSTFKVYIPFDKVKKADNTIKLIFHTAD